MHRVTVIHNSIAERGRATPHAVLAALAQAGFEVRLVLIRGRGDAETVARRAADEGVDLVVAAGGDGTINEVVNGLAGSQATLAVLPIGTTNVLAANVGMAGDPDAFVAAVRAARRIPLWPGEVNGRLFAAFASAGFDARVVAGVDLGLKAKWGKVAYLATAARALATHRLDTYRVTVDGLEHDAAGVVVTKSRYYAGRFSIAPEARLDVAHFQVCLLQGGRRRDVLRAGLLLGTDRLPAPRRCACCAAERSGLSGRWANRSRQTGMRWPLCRPRFESPVLPCGCWCQPISSQMKAATGTTPLGRAACPTKTYLEVQSV